MYKVCDTNDRDGSKKVTTMRKRDEEEERWEGNMTRYL